MKVNYRREEKRPKFNLGFILHVSVIRMTRYKVFKTFTCEIGEIPRSEIKVPPN